MSKGIILLSITLVSHCLDLSLQDSLETELSSVCMRNQVRSYKNFNSCLRFWKNCMSWKPAVKPHKSQSTRLIPHLRISMKGLIDKVISYFQYINSVVVDTSKKCNRTSLKRENKLFNCSHSGPTQIHIFWWSIV